MTYDCFISYSSARTEHAVDVKARACEAGLDCFLAPRDIDPGAPWPTVIGQELEESRNLLVLWSSEAADSTHVQNELNIFAAKGTGKVFLVHLDEGVEDPAVLAHLQHPKTVEQAIYLLADEKITRLNQEVGGLKRELKETEAIIADELEQFLYKKMRRGFFDNKVHIFTCGRDVPPSSGRGDGGRTAIDMWDYQTVCDIHSFFARQNPQTRLHIVPPASKAIPAPEDAFAVGQDLQGKDCIIIGSPDVSDYAEFVWARLHGITPWRNRRDKRSGFVIQKQGGAMSDSAIYWRVEDQQEEGVALVKEGGPEEPYRIWAGDRELVTYGILVLAHNPCDVGSGTEHRVMILAGFTGVATNAVAAFMTNPEYAGALHTLDREMDNSRDVEVLLEVTYCKGEKWETRDDRRIERIEVKKFDYILPVAHLEAH